jgi:adenosine deaminase
MFLSRTFRRLLRRGRGSEKYKMGCGPSSQVQSSNDSSDMKSNAPRDPAKAPKVELHVHLDGAWDGPHLYAMARKHVEQLPISVNVNGEPQPLRQAVLDAEDAASFLDQHVHLPSSTCTLSGFLAPFGWVNAIVLASIRAEGLGALEDFALHFARRQRASNVIYTEVRWCPHLLLEPTVLGASDGEVRYAAARDVLEAVARGLRRGESEFPGLRLRQILCCLDFMPHVSADIARLLREVGRDCGCVGIDVAGGESHFGLPLSESPILQAVKDACAAGFGSTIHAGEDKNTGGAASNVAVAIHEYGASRIGHGYLTLTDASVVDLAKGSGVHFECCPKSSLLTGGFAPRSRPWSDHPLCHFAERGMSCGVNTDDPLMCGICFEDEFRLCLGDMGMASADMHVLTENAIKASFCTEGEKQELLTRVAEFYVT